MYIYIYIYIYIRRLRRLLSWTRSRNLSGARARGARRVADEGGGAPYLPAKVIPAKIR